MKFCDLLASYINDLGCTAQDISRRSGLSAATLSRYRSGDRTPEVGSDAAQSLCRAIAEIAADAGRDDVTISSVTEEFLLCSDVTKVDRERLRMNFNALTSALAVNISKLCRYINYDDSTVFRIKSGTRLPADPEKFADGVASYISREFDSPSDISATAALLGCAEDDLSDTSHRFELLRSWLTENERRHDDDVSAFLAKLNEFDLGEYIRAIRFDEMRAPTLPFQLPTSKTYTGISEMMESELDFLKSTVLSRAKDPVIMYSDMPMEEMSRDPEFPKKWMFGMAMMLKRGLQLNMIHNVDRPLHEMMLGLESYIPMYMTGQISPYYLKKPQNDTFLHLLKVSGAAALSGEAIAGHHADGRYYLTKNRDEIAYYRRRAEALLGCAHPLMQIFRERSADELDAFLATDSGSDGRRRGILSAPPIFTASDEFLSDFLRAREADEKLSADVISYAARRRDQVLKALEYGTIEDEVPRLSREEFEAQPMALPLAGMFCETEYFYTYEEYARHMELSEEFSRAHSGYTLTPTRASTFGNLQIQLHEGKWAMISKNKAPAIHFLIHHPKLCRAIENFIPPVVDTDD